MSIPSGVRDQLTLTRLRNLGPVANDATSTVSMCSALKCLWGLSNSGIDVEFITTLPVIGINEQTGSIFLHQLSNLFLLEYCTVKNRKFTFWLRHRTLICVSVSGNLGLVQVFVEFSK